MQCEKGFVWTDRREKPTYVKAAESQTQDSSGMSSQCSGMPVLCHWAMTARHPPTLTILYMYCTGGTECLSHTPGSHSVWIVRVGGCVADNANKQTPSGHTTQNCQCQQRRSACSPCQPLGSVLDPLICQALKLTLIVVKTYICNRFRLMFSMYVNLPGSRIVSKGHIAVCMLWGSHDVKFGGGAAQTGLHHFHNQ